MSLFRKFFSCYSTDNCTISYTSNFLQEKTFSTTNNTTTNNYNNNNNKNCIICHESVITCLNNQSSNNKHKYLSSTNTNYKQLSSPSSSSSSVIIEHHSQSIQTTQPKAMSVCVTCTTDMLHNTANNNNNNNNNSLDLTTTTNNTSYPYAVTSYPTHTTPSMMPITNTVDMNSSEKSISLQCTKLITRFITNCPFQWNIKSTANQQKANTLNSNNNNWETTMIMTNTLTNTSTIQTITEEQEEGEEGEGECFDSMKKLKQTDADELIEECVIPSPVFNLFLYLAQEGVYAKDLFRRPGNIAQIKVSSIDWMILFCSLLL
ncbi:unnamed protein product [Schistosoma turkestanicum]|nr:unnamed protein product [Schistosoma turkestanicum]